MRFNVKNQCFFPSGAMIVIALLLATPLAWAQPGGAGADDGFSWAAAVSGMGIQVDCAVTETKTETVKIDGHAFRRLLVPGLGVSGELGRPELPAWRRLVEVPSNAVNVQAKVIASAMAPTPKDIEGADLPVYPVQPPVEKIPGALPAPLVWDQAFYAGAGKTGADPVELTYFGVQRGRVLYLITVYPFEYAPASNALDVRTALSFEVLWDCGGAAPQWRDDRYVSPVLDQALDLWLINPTSRDKGGFIGHPAGLLVIAAPAYFSDANLANFVTWKTQRGLHTTLVSTATTGSTASAIQTCIKNAYDTWDIPPSFLVLVGDTDTIPYWTGGGAGSPPTDLNYALLEGTEWNTPDIWYGRISVRNTTQLANALQKTLDYEQRIWSTAHTWEKHASFMAGTDNYAITEGTHNYVISTHFTPAGFTSQKIYQVTYSGTTQQVRDAANQGRSFLVYSGHGSETSWADGPSFTQTDVNNLYNDVFPMVFGFACVTGYYPREECFGETWLRHSSGGLAYWGSSVNSYWNEDDVLEKALFQGFWNHGLMWVGAMLEFAQQGVYAYYGGTSTVRRYFEMYNLMGDPSVDLFTEFVQDLSVMHLPAVPAGVPTFNVSGGPDGAVAALTQGGVIHGVGVISGGSAAIPLDPPLFSGNALLTVTRQNYRPYQVTLPVTAGSAGLLWLDAAQYACLDTVAIMLSDTDLNTNPGTLQTVMVTAASDSEPAGESVLLTETGPDTAIFSGSIALSTVNAPGGAAGGARGYRDSDLY